MHNNTETGGVGGTQAAKTADLSAGPPAYQPHHWLCCETPLAAKIGTMKQYTIRYIIPYPVHMVVLFTVLSSEAVNTK